MRLPSSESRVRADEPGTPLIACHPSVTLTEKPTHVGTLSQTEHTHPVLFVNRPPFMYPRCCPWAFGLSPVSGGYDQGQPSSRGTEDAFWCGTRGDWWGEGPGRRLSSHTALPGTAGFEEVQPTPAPPTAGQWGFRELSRRGGLVVGLICVCLVTQVAAFLSRPDRRVPARSDMRQALRASRSGGCHVFVFQPKLPSFHEMFCM